MQKARGARGVRLNEKRDNKQCLLDTPRKVKVDNKRLISKCKKSREKICISTKAIANVIKKKAMALLRITKRNYS